MIEHFQDPLPDEILYSVWARLSELSNFHTLADVFEELFNNRKIKPIVDLPCHLGHFFDRLPFGHCYTIDVLINDHTLLPFYAPFLSPERYTTLREQMISGNGKAVQRRAGILNIRIPQPLYLRYCPMCVEHDREEFGACYWHRLHQVPGVVVCPTHAIFLENSTVHAQSTFSRQEFISAERVISTPVSRQAESSPLYTFCRDIALDAAYLLNNPTSSLGLEFLQKQYFAMLAQNSFLTLAGLVRKADLIKAFVDYYPAELLRQLNCEVHYARNRQTWLTSLPHRSKHTLHPLHHLLAIRFFGSTIQEFCHRELQRPQFFEPGPWLCLNPVCDHYQQCSINTYQIREMAKGKYQGIFTCECGFSYSRYGQIGSDFTSVSGSEVRAILSYGSVWESKLCELWLDPTVSQKEIARRLQISEVCLKWHATEMHLSPVRDYSTMTGDPFLTNSAGQSRSWYRSQWLNLSQEHPEENCSRLIVRSPLVYKWLLHNDREWLDAHRPSRKMISSQRSTRRDSAEAEVLSHQEKRFSDVHIADTVKSAARILLSDPGRPKRITTTKIKMHVPELIQLLRKPDNIPLTLQALQEVVETREAFAVRRVKYITQNCLEEQVFPPKWKIIEQANLYSLLHIPQVQQALEETIAVLFQDAISRKNG
jgi:hypothetical protein